MSKEPIIANLSPSSAGSAKTTSAISESAMWEQMCQLQSDMRATLVQSKLLTEISKAMLSEQQQMRSQTTKLVETVSTAVERMSDLVASTKDFMAKNEVVMEKISKAIDSLDDAINANDDNVEKIINELRKVVADNSANLGEMSSGIEVIVQAALVLAHVVSNGDDNKVLDAESKAAKKIEDDRIKNEQLRILFRAMAEAERENELRDEAKPE